MTGTCQKDVPSTWHDRYRGDAIAALAEFSAVVAARTAFPQSHEALTVSRDDVPPGCNGDSGNRMLVLSDLPAVVARQPAAPAPVPGNGGCWLAIQPGLSGRTDQ